jgi:hypothetical protein
MLAADFNGDGKLDLAVLNTGDSSVSVLLGNANGTFQPARTSGTGMTPLSLAVGDFNGDGKLDLATANQGVSYPNSNYVYDNVYNNDVSILLGNGDGTFQAPVSVGLGAEQVPQAVAVGDFNGDGTMDLGVTSNITRHGYYYSTVAGFASVLLGHGDGSFSEPNSTLIGGGYCSAAVAANLNGDAFDGFVTINGSGNVSVLPGDSSGHLQGPYLFPTGSHAFSVATGDVNADGYTDLVTANFDGNNVSVLLGHGNGGFGVGGNFGTGTGPASVVLGDFNGDGKVDVATANDGSDNLSMLSGNGNGTFSSALNSAVGSHPFGVAAGDFNGDGGLDAATTDDGSGDVSVLINDHGWPPPNAPAITINDVAVREGNIGTVNATFTIRLSAAYSLPVTVHYATADGTATAGGDYAAASGTVTFAAGQTTQTVTIAVLGDRLPEPSETLFVNLSQPTNATIADGQGVGTILDDEPRIGINNVTKKEGNSGSTLFVFTVSLSVAYDQAVTVKYATANGTATTADHDYQAKSGTLTFAPGQTTQTISVVVYGDKKVESNDTFFVNLSGASSNALFSNWQGIGTILDDDRRR